MDVSDPKIDKHPALRMVEATLANLEQVTDTNTTDPTKLFSQWLNSLAGLLTTAREALLDASKLRTISPNSDAYKGFGFPDLSFNSHRSELSRRFENLGKILEFLRHAFAHGNIELLPGHWIQRQDGPVTVVLLNATVTAIAVSNPKKNRPKELAPTLVLDFQDVVDFVRATAALCLDRTYWNTEALNWTSDEVIRRYGVRPARQDIVIRTRERDTNPSDEAEI